ncbi:MAG: hypothetical protein SGJ04_02250 [Bacteroidota bacterium]|nr:hypothetical protein [Bacteroidota bacterium]
MTKSISELLASFTESGYYDLNLSQRDKKVLIEEYNDLCKSGEILGNYQPYTNCGACIIKVLIVLQKHRK